MSEHLRYSRPRTVYEVHCPGCGKRIRAPSEDERRARVLKHVRNCALLKKSEEPLCVPLDVVAPPEGQ